MYKFIVFSPDNKKTIHQIIDAAASAGAGLIGEYSHCTFITKGQGTWIPLEHAKPLIGQPGKLSKEFEVKIEMECPDNKMHQVAAAIRDVHPYDKIAIDAIKIERF